MESNDQSPRQSEQTEVSAERWQQRFTNFQKALRQLSGILSKNTLNPIEEQGLIKSFEYTYELAWKTLQDYLRYKGYIDIAGPRPVIEQSFQDGLLENGEEWMKMLKNRNLTVHTYDEAIAKEVVEKIRGVYFSIFNQLLKQLQKK